VEALRLAVADGDARGALDILTAAVPDFHASAQAAAWARRQSQFVARRAPATRIA
jgi:hypothetical protein